MSLAARDPSERDASGEDLSTRPHGSFFGRRKGHKLRAHQADLIEHLLPRLALDIGTPCPPDLSEMFDRPLEAVRLEIGFGGGEHLIAEARAFPDTGFIGCEPYVNGMAKILTQIEAHNIGNIRLFAGDAAELLAWLPSHSLKRIDLIHPIRGRSDGTGSAASCRTQRSPPWRARSNRKANFALSAISTITAHGPWRIFRARPTSLGPPNARMTGLSRGPTTP